MNQIKQEPWDASSDYQDYQWNSNAQMSVSPYYNPEILASQFKVEAEDDNYSQSSNGALQSVSKEPKKRGRPKKVREEGEIEGKPGEKKIKQETVTDHLNVVKKKRDRFNGTPEEEVLLKLLPDHLAPNLDILIIGINPGLFAAYVGHHYAGPGNHFWKCLYLAGLIPEPMNAYDDYKLLNYGIGFTNICARTTKGSADLKKHEIREGAEILRKKIVLYKPKIAVFNGKGIYEVFSGNKHFNIGKQPEKVEGADTILFVMPSSSARCAQLPRAADKVPFYLALKKLRDHLRGDLATLEESEVVFPVVDHKSKSEVKDEVSDDDDDSRMSLGDSSKEMTLEQIQMQAEYIEALAASAEGKDIPMESWGGRKLKSQRLMRADNSIDTEASGSGDDSSLPFSTHFQHYQSDLNLKASQPSSTYGLTLGLDIKQEEPYDADEFGPVVVNGPAAQKVSLEQSDSDLYRSSSPQYISLGETPGRKTVTALPYSTNKNQQSVQSSPMQHSSVGYNPSFFSQNRSMYLHDTLARVNSQHNGSSFSQLQSRTNCKEPKSHYINI
ncbi:G/T mismatch-specific thymine DNA glycosylase-like [Biomphalaria glabrata]|uniref:G/T mismatch-specific thymine DNA glycosylase n=1 Tax=Biomphalaria glabrata TaxID=6526 RepID=A0A2C9JWM0_BIOGL|nr:G/T mismatch-specific thymine DNA glycosylase-like [Biomphalaria glabrata]